MTRTFLLAGASTVALSIAAALPAQAQCVQTGGSVTCGPLDDLDGFASSDDGLNIDVLTGILVEDSGGDAFELDGTDNQSFENFGTIFSDTDRAIDVDNGDDLFVDNSGEIDAENDAIRGDDDVTIINRTTGFIGSLSERAIDAGDNLSVTNAGMIDGFDDAIRGDDDMTVVNGFDGEIFSVEQEGIDAGDGADLDVSNLGLIGAGDEGIRAGLGASVFNGTNGVILAIDDAIQIEGDGTITNDGFITSLEEDGLDVDSGTIVNSASGVVVSLGAGAAGIDVDEIEDVNGVSPAERSLAVVNFGLIEGETGILVDPLNMETQVVENSGEIVGFSGVAMDLGAADDRVEVIGDGTFFGDVLFGTGDDILDVSQAGPGIAGSFDAFFDGGSEDFADLIDLGSSVTLADIFVFDDRNPARSRLGFAGVNGDVTVFFTDFELFGLDGQTFTASDISAVAPVPLPAGFGMLLAAAGALGLVARRRA